MVIRHKPNVSVFGMREIFWGMVTCAMYLRAHGYDFVVTSGSEKETGHSWSSLHYGGQACDFRSKHIDPRDGTRRSALRLLDEMRAALGKEFDLVMEDVGGGNEHYHLEFQPKRD